MTLPLHCTAFDKALLPPVWNTLSVSLTWGPTITHYISSLLMCNKLLFAITHLPVIVLEVRSLVQNGMAGFPSGGSKEESASRLIQVVGRIQLLVVVELRSPFLVNC